MSEIPVDMQYMPPPPAHEELMVGAWGRSASSIKVPPPSGMLSISNVNQAPASMIWMHEGVEFATIMCCGCSARFMPHGDVVIVPCKKHKKRMLATGGHCEAKK